MPYETAYALRYNPFNLLNAIPGVPALDGMPLQMADDERLVPYYFNDIYPATSKTWKKTPFDFFVWSMRDRGYNDGKDGPQAVGEAGLVVLIRGEKGTGKTTLAHRMIRWLKSCDPANTWHYEPWLGGAHNAVQQKASLTANFLSNVLAGGSGRFLCLLEDLQDGADETLIEIYPQMATAAGTLCIFMTTHDAALRSKKFGASKPTVVVCDTNTLTADVAVKYCAKRLNDARCGDAPNWMAQYPLFPFTEEIIRRSLIPSAAAQELWDVPGSVGIREFNKIFADLLSIGQDGLAAGFDIRNIAADKAAGQLIYPVGVDEKVA